MPPPRTPFNPRVTILAVLILAFLMGRMMLRREQDVSWSGVCMGTLTYEVKIAQANLRPNQRAALQVSVKTYLDDLNRQISTYLPDSDISRFNRAESTNAFPVSAEFADLVRASLAICAETEGAFDPTVGPLIELWGFGAAGPRTNAPGPAEIEAARALSGWRHLRVTDGNELVKAVPGLQINLSAIACGWAVDRVSERLLAAGFTNHYVNLSGEVRCVGLNFRGEPWKLGIPEPARSRTEEGALLRTVPLADRGMATSGDYHNYFEAADGTHYSHVIDPVSGRPVTNDLASATILAPTAAEADALATAAIVWGLPRALEFVSTRPRLSALFIRRTGETLDVQTTPNWPGER
jgi:FAD:protein FMN transferase